MELDDPALPAVAHLTGPGAVDVVGAAVAAAGGVLHDLRTSHVQYRPGADLVVRYRGEVTWSDGQHVADETLLAAANRGGALPGTVPVVAEADGRELEASVWRWPFDPLLPALQDAVTPGRGDHVLAPLIGATRSVEVVAYRPTERAVVRVEGAEGRAYVKVVPPAELPALVARHERLLAAGLPVPEVLATTGEGLVVLAERPGTTFRQRIKDDLAGWPTTDHLCALLERLHALPADVPSARGSRTADGRGHAALLAAVLPDHAGALSALAERFGAGLDAVQRRSGPMVHGDLHEGQLVVEASGAVSGLLDVDDAGAGDPLDDLATLAAHLRFRAAVLEPDAPGRVRRRLLETSDDLRSRAAARWGRTATDVTVAAVLVGLATGPFRLQREGWQGAVAATITDATRIAGLVTAGCRT